MPSSPLLEIASHFALIAVGTLMVAALENCTSIRVDGSYSEVLSESLQFAFISGRILMVSVTASGVRVRVDGS